MGLSRRIFTKEFKLAAVRRLEQGFTIGEAARVVLLSSNCVNGLGKTDAKRSVSDPGWKNVCAY